MSDDEFVFPLRDAFDCINGIEVNVAYGTLSRVSSTVTSPDGVTRRLLQWCPLTAADSLFVDIGCGRGRVVNLIASHVGCPCIGVDISPTELALAREDAKRAGVDNLCHYCQGDYRTFHDTVVDAAKRSGAVRPRAVCVYFYLIPQMINNRALRDEVIRLLESDVVDATVVCWMYLPRDWPYVTVADDRFSLCVYRRSPSPPAQRAAADRVAAQHGAADH